MREGPITRQCTATSKRSGERCRHYAAVGFSVCQYHGAGSPKKRAGRPIETGRYSKHAPIRLLARIEDALADPELMSVRQQFALLDALLIDRLDQMGDQTHAQLWDEALEAFRKDDQPSLKRALGNGRGKAHAEQELRQIVQEQAVLARTEAVREKTLMESVTSKQLNVLLALILDSIRNHVHDDDVRRAIQADLLRAVGPGFGGRSDPAGTD